MRCQPATDGMAKLLTYFFHTSKLLSENRRYINERYNYLFMNGKMRLLMAILIVYPLSIAAQGIDDIIKSLKNVECYESTVKYQVLMSLQADVSYTVKLNSMNAPGDSLAPCDYLINWSLATPDGESTGFSAYYDGNAYNFRGDRLMEYHYEWDSIPFRPRGRSAAALPGVQRSAQFTTLLPQFIAEELMTIVTSPEYTYSFHADTVVADRRCNAIEAVMTMGGEVYKEITYAFDPVTSMPLYSEIENNPGALAEQTLISDYSYAADKAPCAEISEEGLREMYPDIFEKYRESNYAIENLPQQRLPAFSLPTTTGERYSRLLGDKFRTPTLIVIIDPASTFARATVNDIRKSIEALPYNADVIWAFVSTNTDIIDEIIPQPLMGEHILMNAKSLARDCGVSSYPVSIIVGTDGVVDDVILGYNNELTSVVIQKMALAAKSR